MMIPMILVVITSIIIIIILILILILITHHTDSEAQPSSERSMVPVSTELLLTVAMAHSASARRRSNPNLHQLLATDRSGVRSPGVAIFPLKLQSQLDIKLDSLQGCYDLKS